MAYISMAHSLPAVNQSTTSLTASVWADMCLSSGESLGGLHTRSWSGHWGSGSSQIDVGWMTAGQCIRIVTGSGAAVTLTDVAQTRAFAASMQLPWGTVYGSRTVTYPARYALTPTSLTVTRDSDTQHTLNWTRNSTYSSVVVQRRTDDGDWQTVGQPTGNPASFIDTTTLPNRKYEYRVAGVGGSGQSPWSSTVVVFTTPAPPSSVTAQKVGFDIEVDASGLPLWWDSFDIEDNSSIIQSGVVTFPWLDVAPSSGSPHTYRVRAVKGALVSDWSTPSNTVQLLAAPNAPTNLAPNGITANADAPIRLSWVHNPVDTTAQSAYELQWRVGAGAWTTLSGTVDQFRDVTLSAGLTIEWQVRTKGQHPDWSPWSASAFFDAIAQPGVAILQPTASWDQPQLPLIWSWFQADGRPQSSWQAQLLDASSVLLESRSAPNSATTVTFNTRLEHNQQYTVRVRGQAGNVWSEWAEQLFLVEFVAPAPALFSGEWDEGLGAVNITVCEGSGPVHPDVVNLFTNPAFVTAGAEVRVPRGGIIPDEDPDFEIDGSDMVGTQPAGITPFNCLAVQSDMFAAPGQKSLRIIPTSANTQSGVSVGAFGDWPADLTVTATIHLAEAQTGSLDAGARQLLTHLPGESQAAPNVPGSYTLSVREPAGSGGQGVDLYCGAAVGGGDVYWTLPTIVAGEYTGPPFAGSSAAFYLDGSYMVPKWDGADDASTSTAEHAPATVLVDIERSVDDRGTWEPVVTGATWDAEGCVSVSDFESLSCGITLYRVTTHAASEAATAEVSEVMSSSQAIWLGTGSGFQITARLPYDPMITNDRGRRRVVEEYEGREVGIAYASQRRTNTLTAAGTILDRDETAATREELESIIDAYYPVHLYRDMHGRRVYGVVSTLTENRLGVRRVCEATCDAGVWTYGFALAESGRD